MKKQILMLGACLIASNLYASALNNTNQSTLSQKALQERESFMEQVSLKKKRNSLFLSNVSKEYMENNPDLEMLFKKAATGKNSILRMEKSFGFILREWDLKTLLKEYLKIKEHPRFTEIYNILFNKNKSVSFKPADPSLGGYTGGVIDYKKALSLIKSFHRSNGNVLLANFGLDMAVNTYGFKRQGINDSYIKYFSDALIQVQNCDGYLYGARYQKEVINNSQRAYEILSLEKKNKSCQSKWKKRVVRRFFNQYRYDIGKF